MEAAVAAAAAEAAELAVVAGKHPMHAVLLLRESMRWTWPRGSVLVKVVMEGDCREWDRAL